MMIILLKKKQANKQTNNKNSKRITTTIQLTTATMKHLFMRDKLGNGIKLLKVLKSSDMDKRNSKQRFLFYKLVS